MTPGYGHRFLNEIYRPDYNYEIYIDFGHIDIPQNKTVYINLHLEYVLHETDCMGVPSVVQIK